MGLVNPNLLALHLRGDNGLRLPQAKVMFKLPLRRATHPLFHYPNLVIKIEIVYKYIINNVTKLKNMANGEIYGLV
jgi:hypothetical protein